MRRALDKFTILILAVTLVACEISPDREAVRSISLERKHELERRFNAILDDYEVATIGAALIEQGELVWTGYYGEQAPGVKASNETMFNVASITKTVTSELVVRLAEQNQIDLDESISNHWVDPDVRDDARHRLLTPRLSLRHATGFPNWRYVDPQFKLRFNAEPGTVYGYSGEGMEYVAKFVENKLGATFDELVKEHVFSPLGLQNMSVTAEQWVIEKLALPVNLQGNRQKPFCNSKGDNCAQLGQWSAADELATTVEDYARFLIAVMKGKGISPTLQKERFRIQTSTAEDKILRCALANSSDCPIAQGYGLGWEIFEFTDAKIISHGGGDWSERAMVYFDEYTNNGIVLFINGASEQIIDVLIVGLETLDKDSKIAAMYRGWVNNYNASQSE